MATEAEKLLSKLPNEEGNCNINGLEVLDNDRLAVTDWANNAVKILSVREKTVTAHLRLNIAPWDITQVNRRTLAITCLGGSYVQLVTVEAPRVLSRGQKIPTDGICRGIQYLDTDDGRFVVSLTNPPRVHVIDMSGNVLKDLSNDSTGTPLFKYPYYIAVSPDSNTVYVSDLRANTLTGMTLDGSVVFNYRDEQFADPRGVAVGEDGMIYACGELSHNVHVISSTGEKVKVILAQKDLIGDLRGLAFNKGDNKLYVGMSGNNNVLGFSLSK